MEDIAITSFLNRPDLYVETDGEFAGWRTWNRDPFECHLGPFWHRINPDDSVCCAYRVERRHVSATGNVHGGCHMAFADYSLFAIASPLLTGPGITVAFGCEFLDAAREGDRVEGTGQVTRAGGSLIFVRGQLSSAERTLFTFSATLKRVKPSVRPR